MRVVTRAATVAGGALAMLLCAGFGGGGGHAAQPRGSVQACTAFGVRAIEHHLTVRAVPAACQGLSRAQVNLAIGRAIYEVAGAGQHKAAWRRRAAAVGARLEWLITSLPPAASPPRGTRTAAAAGQPPPDRFPLGLATLAAWLAAAATGGYIAARRVIRGGRPRRGPGRGGGVATVLFGHAGLAATGLLVWVSFLVSGLTGLAWAAACLLLPVAGLGMATLTLWAPEPRPGTAGPPAPGQTSPLRVILPIVHGLAASATILLALLTALGAG